MTTTDFLNIVKRYSNIPEQIAEYIPGANIEEIYIVKDLKKFLSSKTEEEATNAIKNASGYFQNTIGYRPYIFDETQLDALVREVAAKAAKQKQMSKQELLNQIGKYQALVLQVQAEHSKSCHQNTLLTGLFKNALETALRYGIFMPKDKKQRFSTALRLMADQTFMILSKNNQITVLHNVIIGGESAETAMKFALYHAERSH